MELRLLTHLHSLKSLTTHSSSPCPHVILIPPISHCLNSLTYMGFKDSLAANTSLTHKIHSTHALIFLTFPYFWQSPFPRKWDLMIRSIYTQSKPLLPIHKTFPIALISKPIIILNLLSYSWINVADDVYRSWIRGDTITSKILSLSWRLHPTCTL